MLWLVTAIGSGAVLWNVFAVLRAARQRRQHPPSCAADAEPDDVPWPAQAVALVARVLHESLLTTVVVLTLPLPRARGAHPSGGGRRPVVLLRPRALHPVLFGGLARVLRRDGHSVVAMAWNPRRPALAADAGALGAALERVARDAGVAAVDVLAYGDAGLAVRDCLGARRGRTVHRVITLGTPHDAPHTDARDGATSVADCIAIYSADDAAILAPARGYWAGAFNIELRGPGHLGLLRSARVRELVRENLLADGDGSGVGVAGTAGAS